MNFLSLDALIVAAFLITILLVGLFAGRDIKDIREYAVANKMFGTAALVLTYMATEVGGQGVINIVGEAGTTGIIIIVAFMSFPLAFIIQGLFIAPKMARFSQCMTMGDVMGHLYKGPSQVITGVLACFTAFCIAGMELTVIGILCETLLGIDYRWGVGLGGLILIVYTSHGGIKAVTFTDMFQFLALFIALPMITVAALKQVGGIQDVFVQVPGAKLQIFSHPKGAYYLTLFLSLSVFQFSVIDPALVQRILMGRTKEQLRRQFFIVSSLTIALMLSLILLGLASFVLYPEATDTPVILRVVNDVLPAGIKGLAAAGLLAVTMATFDSFLHAAGLTLVHDVIRPLYNRNGSKINELFWVRYVTILIGILTMIVGFMRADDLYNFVLISYKFTGPLLAFPLFAGVLGLKPDQLAFYAATGVTIVVLLLVEALLPAPQAHLAPFISVIVNGMVFLGMHIVRNRGLVIIKR